MKSVLLIIIVCGNVSFDVLKARHMSLDELYIQDDDELSANLYGETDEDNEDWVRESILDVAYYIRSHKFNNYDRRFMNESNKILNLFESFPKALKALHWEVNKYCVKGFLKCLKYIGKKIKESDLQRRQDTKNIMNENKWRFPENFNAINVADVECERLLQADYKNPVPFQSPLERFDWTITASYYMCWFTMQEHPSLSLFEEKCDNMANCLDSRIQTDYIADPRSNNDYPYQCSLYSFCPDICCPLRKVTNFLECLNSPFNPCNQEHTRNFTCTVDRRKNTDLTSIILNKWNYSCECTDGIFSEWSPMFGMCTDVNECEKYNNPCNKITQECVNKKGSFDCICKAGYTWDSTKNLCYPIPIFNESIKQLAAPTKKHKSIWRSDIGFSIIKGIFIYLFPNDEDEYEDDDLLKHR